jgi:TolB-like protein/tetratricopeptide (TPR) repeat protein
MLFQFADILIDIDRREIVRDGVSVHVEPQVFDLLHFFARNSNRSISKQELIDCIWKGRAISDAALNCRINAARRAIGDSGKQQTLIRTIHRRGFLFAAEVTIHGEETSKPAPRLSTPVDLPSIVVLALRNLSGDAQLDYFADGLVEEIVTGLSRIKWLFVIARNSSVGRQNVDVRNTGREINVRYMLMGSVRKVDDRVRISVQLTEAETGVHIWAECFDRRLEDVFALQDEITLSVIGAIEPSMRDAEIGRVEGKRPKQQDAYDLVLRASPDVYAAMPQRAVKAVPLLEQALVLEPGYGVAHGLLGWCHQVLFLRAGYREDNWRAAVSHARAAITYGRDDSMALALGALVTALAEHDRARSLEAFERALALNTLSPFAFFIGCTVQTYWGDAERAMEWAGRALLVSPRERLAYKPYSAMALGHFMRGQFEESASNARKAIEINPGASYLHAYLAAPLVKLGRVQEATSVAKRALALQPTFTVERHFTGIDAVPSLALSLGDALQVAGLPS